jgi:hypothetical protein
MSSPRLKPSRVVSVAAAVGSAIRSLLLSRRWLLTLLVASMTVLQYLNLMQAKQDARRRFRGTGNHVFSLHWGDQGIPGHDVTDDHSGGSHGLAEPYLFLSLAECLSNHLHDQAEPKGKSAAGYERSQSLDHGIRLEDEEPDGSQESLVFPMPMPSASSGDANVSKILEGSLTPNKYDFYYFVHLSIFVLSWRFNL